MRFRYAAYALVAALVLTTGATVVAANRSAIAADQCFPETGKCISGLFYEYWLANGGLTQQGYPITDAFDEVNPTDGKTYKTQYFERARFEHHPENAGTPFEVLLGLLGREQYLAKYPGGSPVGGTGDICFDVTGRCIRGIFHRYWQEHGGLAQQGYPISDEFDEVNPTDGKTYRTQYFERARFEHHPENAGSSFEVLLGLLGREQYLAKPAPPTGGGPTAPPPTGAQPTATARPSNPPPGTQPTATTRPSNPLPGTQPPLPPVAASTPAYDPNKGFSDDAQRVLDLANLQVGLERYRVARSRYPATLAELFPEFAPEEDGRRPNAPPVDPATRQPYQYAPSSDGRTYQLSATLSTGEVYTRTNP